MNNQTKDSIFVEFAPSRDRALGELAELLGRIGFVLKKKAARESTLRVYPKSIHEYPVLNPRFRETDDELGIGLDRPSLVIDVHTSDEAAEEWTERLRRFASSENCAFVENGRRHAGLFHNGWFVLPLTFSGDASAEIVNFPALEQPLTFVYQFLNANERRHELPPD